jgi:hypothetical protein
MPIGTTRRDVVRRAAGVVAACQYRQGGWEANHDRFGGLEEGTREIEVVSVHGDGSKL